MSEIRRWDIQLSIEPEDGEVRAHITEAPDGYLVLHSDYTTERTAREAAEAAVARMREQCEALAAGWYAKHAAGGHSTDLLDAADELRALLEGRRYSEDEHG